jgi:hypothetical protein
MWGIITSATLVAAFPALAAEQSQIMKYDIYAGGFHVVDAQLDVKFPAKERYHLVLGARTQGFLADLAPWHGVFRTDGWLDAKTQYAQPEVHQSITTWRDEEEIKTYKYNRDGTFKEYSIKDPDPGNDGSPKPVEPELTNDTTDALSATFMVMQEIARTGGCTGGDHVFDGKRSYTMMFNEVKKVELEKTRYNVYAGPAVQCTVEVKPGAGKWHEKPRGWMSIQEQGRERGTMPTVWFATMQEGGPAVPVKILVKTEYGALVMHLTGYDNGVTKLAMKEDD